MKKQKGFTLIEVLIGGTIGIMVLSALLMFFLGSSKIIQNQQGLVKDASDLQFVMNKISEDIKDANTEAPTANSSLTSGDWLNLPSLCYIRPFNTSLNNPICQPALATYPKEAPTYPVAYQFQWQSGLVSDPNGWYPKINSANAEDSNQLGFYKVINGRVTRILYFTEPDPAFPVSENVFRLRRKQQMDIIASSDKYVDATLQTTENTVIAGIKFAQFTYPPLIKKLDSTSIEYDLSLFNVLNGLIGSETDVSKRAYMQSEIMNKYRNIIGIKISVAGPLSKKTNTRVNAFGLYTEVNIRN